MSAVPTHPSTTHGRRHCFIMGMKIIGMMIMKMVITRMMRTIVTTMKMGSRDADIEILKRKRPMEVKCKGMMAMKASMGKRKEADICKGHMSLVCCISMMHIFCAVHSV